MRSAVRAVATVDAATEQLIAVLALAIGVFAALHAAAAVAGTQASHGRCRTLAIFVTLITDQAMLVTAVLPHASFVFDAFFETAIGERVTRKTRLAIGGGDAGHAAVPGRLAAG